MRFDNRNEMEKFSSAALLQGFGNTDIEVFLYYPAQKRIEVPKKVCDRYNCAPVYENMPYSLGESFVHPDDYPVFYEQYRKIDQGLETSTAVFHSKDKSLCWRVTLTLVARAEDGSPKEALGIIEDITELDKEKETAERLRRLLSANVSEDTRIREARDLISNTIAGQFFALYHIWLEERRYICFQERLAGILDVIGETGDYEPAWDSYIANYIVPEDQAEMHRFADINTMAQRLMDKQVISHEYRRREIGWTRGQFMVAKRDDSGKPTNVIYTVMDINAEKNMELAQNKAMYEANHDALTGAYNRKAFDEITNSPKNQGVPIGLAIIDVDNFKIANDAFGHEKGDTVLREIADLLKNVFRVQDSVFRLGGDEFAVLLYNCKTVAWETLCKKQHYIHTTLDQMFKDISITLSMGIAFSEDGYSEALMHKADECLYDVKRNGRAGCAMADMDSGETRSWREDTLSYKSTHILEYNNTGVYRVEYPLDGVSSPRLYCGDMALEIFGMNKEDSPEACYRWWLERIEPSYVETLTETRQVLLQGKPAECTYLWNHPAKGKIFIRTGGTGEVIDGVQVLRGYHHSMQGTVIMERKDESRQILDSVSAIYFCIYYIDLDNDSFTILKNTPGEKSLNLHENRSEESLNSFLETMVSPDDLEKMRAFTNHKTLRQRMQNELHLDCEYYSLGKNGWCRATYFPVKYDANGRLTHVLFVLTSLDEQRSKEARKGAISRKSIESLYNNVPGGIVLYEASKEGVRPIHVSAYYKKVYGEILNHDGEQPTEKTIYHEDFHNLLSEIKKTLLLGKDLHCDFRMWNLMRNAYSWTHIDATCAAQTDGSRLVYALFTDVSEQKALLHSLEKNRQSMAAALSATNLHSYEYDPVLHTGVCFTEENFFGLPRYIENYPDSLGDINFFHPEDAELFIRTAHSMDSNPQKAQCDVRILKNGEYKWYSCIFDPYFDADKQYNVAILTVIDISLRVSALKSYEDRLHALLATKENTLSMCTVNLTKNTYEMVGVKGDMQQFVDAALPLDAVLMSVADKIVDKELQEEYRRVFNRENLIAQAESGNLHVMIEYPVELSDKHYEWVAAVADMVKNPITGEITGVTYSYSTQERRMGSDFLTTTLKQDYLFAAAIFVDTDEFYLYNATAGRFMNRRSDYWNYTINEAKGRCDEKMRASLDMVFQKETILKTLETEPEVVRAFDGQMAGGSFRIEMRYRYLDKKHTMLLASMRNITDLTLLSQLRHNTEHDPLTDLYNRKKVFRECRRALEENPNKKFVMAHVNIKRFRMYNTFFGDEAGDSLLRDMANLLRKISKDYKHFVYGRIEADVFCLFFTSDREKYNRHTAAALEYFKNYREDYLIEPTIGLYYVTDAQMSIEAMFTRATLAAKEIRPNTPYATVVYNEALERELSDRQRVLNEMHTAIEQEQFEVYLQPKVSLSTKKAVGAEALVRWVHPTRGVISPAGFIPVFESNGFITVLDRYMWERVCRLLRRWKDEGKTLVPISVNVSRLSMFGTSTVEYLKSLTQKYGIAPKYLELELTETAYTDDPEEMKAQLTALREAGFTVLMDDFGSGYSGLKALRELPVDVLKLDMKFLPLNQRDVRGGLVLSTIIRMAKLLNLMVIAEGVETQEQADFLMDSGCEYVQGYLFARPMSVADYEENIEHMDVVPQSSDHALQNNIGRILAATDSIDNLEPMVCLEYTNREFAFLKVNAAFTAEFGLTAEASNAFKERLLAKSADNLLRAFEESIRTKGSTQTALHWRREDGEKRVYICRVAYIGEIGASAALALLLTEVPQTLRALMKDEE